MDIRQVYRGTLLKSYPVGGFTYLATREITVFAVIGKEKSSFFEIEKEVSKKHSLFQVTRVNELYLVARTNSPTTGAVIILNIDDSLKTKSEYVKELLRCAFSDVVKKKLLTLETIDEVNIEKDIWINQRLLNMFEDASDLLEYELN
jgi:hypothetical protein